MLSLYIDESGQFENRLDADHAVVGGVLVKHRTAEDLDQVGGVVQEGLIRICGEDYHRRLHGEARDFQLQNGIIQDVIHARELNGQLFPVYIQRAAAKRTINSNITDDNTACMLYFNMLNELLTSVLLYYPDLLADENEIRIHLASRVAVHSGRDEERRKAFESVGLTFNRGSQGDALYYLNNETSVLIHLNDALRSYPYLERRLSIHISKIRINYENRGSSGVSMNMLYLADIICNHVYHSRKWADSPNRLRHGIAFAYGDINDAYQRLYRAYCEKNWFAFASGAYYFPITYAESPFLKVYNTYIRTLLVRFPSQVDRQSLDRLLFEAQQLVQSGAYNRQHALYVLRIVETLTGRLGAELKVTLYDCMLQVFNHTGADEEGERAYELALQAAGEVGSFEMLERKRAIMTRYATTCTNRFDFTGALELADRLIESQLAMQELQATMDLVLFNSLNGADKDIFLGKQYSSKGQFMAFLRREEAYDWFHKAIALFGDNGYNRSQTLSYLVHYLAESDRPLTPADRALTEEYLGTGGFADGAEAFLTDKGLFAHTPGHFRLFAWIKWYRYRYPSEIRNDALVKLAHRIMEQHDALLEHPWPLILTNMAELLQGQDKKLATRLLHRAHELCLREEHHFTIRLIGKHIQLKIKEDQRSLDELIGLIRAKDHPALKTYFELDKAERLPFREQVQAIASKFTFTYH